MPRKNATSITFQATPEEKEQLQAYCEAHQRSQTEILRELIRTLPKASQGDLIKGRLHWNGELLWFIDKDGLGHSMEYLVQLPDGSYAKTSNCDDDKLPLLVDMPKNHMPSKKAVTVEIVDNVVVRIAEIH